MGDTGHQSWWTTLPGVITALATLITAIGGLVVALNKPGTQQPNGPPTQPPGIYDAGKGGSPPHADPAPPAKPEPAPKPMPTTPTTPEPVYDLFTLTKYNYSFPYPKNLLSPVGKPSEFSQKFMSADGLASMSLMIVPNSDASLTPEKSLEEVAQLLSQRGAEILHKTHAAHSFGISWKEGSKLHRDRFVIFGGRLLTLSMTYEESLQSTFDPIAVHIAKAIEP